MDPIEGIIRLSDHVAPAALVFARVGGVFITAPILGGGSVPWQVRALLTLAITLILVPSLGDQYQTGLPGALYPLAMIKELGMGLAIGFLLGLFLEAIRFAGDIIGRSAGFAAAEIFNPDAGTMEGPVGGLFFLAVTLLFFMVDGHLELIAAFARSYQMVPVGSFSIGPHCYEVVSVGLGRTFEIAVTIALPIEGAVLAITVAEGVMARAVPQINILHITFAVKIMTTLMMLLVGIPAMIAFFGFVIMLAQDMSYAFMMAAGGG